MPRAIDLLLDEIIPSDLRGNLTDLSGSNVNDFLVELYTKYPDKYKAISHDLGRLGSRSAYIQGETLGLEDFEPVVDKPLLLAAMNDEIAKAKEKFGNSDQFKKARESIWVRYNDMMLKNTVSGAKATNNRIGHAVISGARGKTAQMQAMLTTPGLYADSKGDIVPMFIENSFAEGLRPLEFAAGMFGARASVISTKAATAKGGDYGKLLSQASARLLVTDKDCGVKNGIAYDIDDNTARNRILSRDVGNFKAGTMLTREVLADLKKNNISKIVARSPLTCNADGLCSQCVGMTFENKFPKVGDHVGITAANAVCLEENTEILMADGTVKAIKDIVPGEFVIGVDEQGIAKSSKVLDNYDRGEQHCYEFFYTFLKDMSSIIATKNHRCVVNDTLIPLGEIDEHNSYFTLPKEIHIENFIKLHLLEEVKETYSGRIVNMEYHGFYKTRDLYIEHPNHVFLTKDFIQVHNSEPVTQGALCLAADSLVRMADFSTKKIQEIKVGDKVLGADKNGNCFPVSVKDTFNQGIKSVYSTSFKLGSKSEQVTLLSTLDHKILANKKTNGKIYFEKYNGKFGFNSPESYIAQVLPVGYTHKDFAAVLVNDVDIEGINVPEALFLGIFAGDGIRFDTKNNTWDRVKFSCADPQLVDDLNAYLKQFDISLKKLKRGLDYSFTYNNFSSITERDNAGKFVKGEVTHPLKKALISANYADKYCYEKSLPAGIYSWNKKSIMNFIAGYLATDGSISFKNNSCSISFSSTSFDLLKGLSDLLSVRFGIYSGKIYEYSKNRKLSLFSLAISRSDQVLKLLNQLSIPGKKKIISDKFIEFSKNITLRHPENFYRAKRYNQTYVGEINCYDIEVDHEDHLFVLANNLIVSNSAKHTGGQATQKGEYGGFPILSQFVQSPTEYMHKAITPDEDGQVSNIEEAPQGGYNVFVNNKSYYVKPGYPLTVKVGQQVESGQPLSEGIVDARDVVEKVGLGAGRKYWVDRIQKIYKDSGLYADKKNLEIVARGTLDTVSLDEEIDGVDAYMDDVVNYNKIKKVWKPTEAFKKSTDMSLNKYLASDTLEHTIGTRVTPSIQKQFQEAGINELDVMDKKPPFSPNMDRLRTASHYNDDWLAGLSTSYLKKQLEDNSLRAATTNIKENQHWAPRIAVGVDFGKNIKETGKF